MLSSKELKGNLEVVSAISDITSIYQEIASLRIKQMRVGVAKTHEFLSGVAEVYNHAKVSYITTLQRQLKAGRKDFASAAFVKRNGKKVLVLLSANEHLYGTLILDVWHLFVKDLRAEKADAVIIGSVGKYFARNEKIASGAAWFFLDDDKPTATQIKKIVDFISRYEQIVVYHGEMVSVLNQTPAMSNISGGVALGEKVEKAKSYLFEPSPERILEFFENEIIGALFNQKIYEHQLARFAARMVAMDQATENAKETLNKLSKEFRDLKRSVSNRKQLEVFAGYSFWGSLANSKEGSL